MHDFESWFWGYLDVILSVLLFRITSYPPEALNISSPENWWLEKILHFHGPKHGPFAGSNHFTFIFGGGNISTWKEPARFFFPCGKKAFKKPRCLARGKHGHVFMFIFFSGHVVFVQHVFVKGRFYSIDPRWCWREISSEGSDKNSRI